MTEPSTADIEQIFSQALQLHQSGELGPAEGLYREVLAAEPNHIDSLNLLGLIALQSERNDMAADFLGRAISLNDRIADFHNSIAEAHRRLGRDDLALTHFAKAAQLDPTFVDAKQNYGRMLLLVGRIDEAAAQFRGVLAIEPSHGQAKWGLADALSAQGALDEAARLYQDVLALKPNLLPIYQSLARIRLAQSQADDALAIVTRALQIEPSAAIKTLFAHALADARNIPNTPDMRQFVAAALSEPWTRPMNLAGAATRLVKTNTVIANSIARITAPGPKQLSWIDLFGPFGITVLAKDELLQALLESAPVCDADLERLLTVIRLLLLESAAEPNRLPIDLEHLRFYCALARQCFINGYVYARTPIDDDLVSRARTALETALQAGTVPHPLLPIAIATYLPLHTVVGAEKLASIPAPPPLAALFAQQISEPMSEQNDAVSIPELTEIDDDVSLAVQRQYEENPYPTWVAAEPADRSESFDARMRQRFPAAPFQALAKPNPDILIAGCGTGQHSIETAQAYPDAKVLAIDLSLASLAYAQRKTREAGLRNLDYAQADILKLGDIGRSFDVIESSGVLHHLRDPMQGWRILLSLLRPGGAMRLGFYSRSARSHVRAARDFIVRGGYQPNPEGIRRCRQTVMMSKDPSLVWVAQSPDFFSTSSCRDLLFHVQEHQLTLPEIKAFLADNGLTMLGFENLPAGIYEDYRRRFPQDLSLTDFDHWHALETEHPHLFGGMYQFWIQKPR